MTTQDGMTYIGWDNREYEEPERREVDPRIREYARLLEAGDKEAAMAVWEELEQELEAKARAKVAANEAVHAAFHGRPLKYITVERGHGRKGRSVCRDCYYGREWR